MKTHHLKTEPKYFEEVRYNKKKFELRKNDRDFQVNDTLVLQEYDRETKQYSGSSVSATVTYILHEYNTALHEDYCIMSIDVFDINDDNL